MNENITLEDIAFYESEVFIRGNTNILENKYIRSLITNNHLLFTEDEKRIILKEI